jgi:hypothetical protein
MRIKVELGPFRFEVALEVATLVPSLVRTTPSRDPTERGSDPHAARIPASPKGGRARLAGIFYVRPV